MFPLRHAAARLLTSKSIAVSARSRTITTFTSLSQRQPRIAAPLQFQRRWASGEAEAQKEEAPVSQLQPTPEEEVENVLQTEGLNNSDGTAAPSESDAGKAPQIAETANATEATEDITNTATESQDVQETIDDIPAPAKKPHIASALTEGLEDKSSKRRSSRPIGEAPQPKKTVYVGNLFFDVTEVMLEKEFGRYGVVENVRLIRDARGLSKGFGYVSFKDVETATNAMNELNQQLFEGRRLMVSYAHTDNPAQSQQREHRPINPPSKTLFIGNMSFEMTDRDLNNLFRGIRNVIDVRVAIDRRTGQPRGFAHADFTDMKSAMEAMKVLQGKETYGRALRVDYSFGPSAAPRNTPQ